MAVKNISVVNPMRYQSHRVKILGIDPGTIKVGYGVIEKQGNNIKTLQYGAIKAKGRNLPERLKKIYSELIKIIKKQKPTHIVVEKVFFSKDASATIKMGEGRGVALLAATHTKAEIFEYTPAEVKKAVTGNGRANKYEVQQMVRAILNLKDAPEPEDAADALAIAICHYNRM